MTRDTYKNKRLVSLFLLGCLLFNYPILSIFNLPETVLGIPLLYGVDAVHEHTNVYGATVLPHNIGLGATGDTDLVRRIAEARQRARVSRLAHVRGARGRVAHEGGVADAGAPQLDDDAIPLGIVAHGAHQLHLRPAAGGGHGEAQLRMGSDVGCPASQFVVELPRTDRFGVQAVVALRNEAADDGILSLQGLFLANADVIDARVAMAAQPIVGMSVSVDKARSKEARAAGTYLYSCNLPCTDSGRYGFTVRVTPNADAWIRYRPELLTWA